MNFRRFLLGGGVIHPLGGSGPVLEFQREAKCPLVSITFRDHLLTITF